MSFAHRTGLTAEAGSQAKGQQPMRTESYTISYTVDQSPQEVFNAINNVRGWWSGEIDGRTDKLGAEFTYRYQNLHRTTQKITELMPGKKVLWHIVDSHINFVQDKAEWTGTDVVFEIAKKARRLNCASPTSVWCPPLN